MTLDELRIRLAEALGQDPLRLFQTVSAIADVMEVDPRTIHRGIEAGVIPAVRLSSSTIRIPTDAFIAQVLQLPQQHPLDQQNSSQEHSEAGPARPANATVHALTKSTGGIQHDSDPAA